MQLSLDDPNTWEWLNEATEYRIYTSEKLDHWAVVDAIDYAWLCKWKWSLKYSRGGRKAYLYRTGHFKGLSFSVYMHVAIMRKIAPPPDLFTPLIVDHRDGDSFNCRRYNLRWATYSLNRKNINGKHP